MKLVATLSYRSAILEKATEEGLAQDKCIWLNVPFGIVRAHIQNVRFGSGHERVSSVHKRQIVGIVVVERDVVNELMGR